MKTLIASLMVLAGALVAPSPGPAAPDASTLNASTPNVVIILTDDQVVDTLQKMPNVRELAATGTTFSNAFISNPLCCPSRATILTGLFSGHTGVWTNADGKDPNADQVGGYHAFTDNGNETRTIAYYLHTRLGYDTGLYGKYLNHYDPVGQGLPTVQGWTDFHAFSGKDNNEGGAYYNYDLTDGTLNPDGTYHTEHFGPSPADYSTNVLADQAVDFLHSQAPDQPFFLYFAPFAPHGVVVPGPGDRSVKAPGPYVTAAYNEQNVADKPLYIRGLPLINSSREQFLQESWDHEYGALKSVDRAVGRFEAALSPEALANTMFVFLSDNGETWGDHRWVFKLVPYERSIHVPFIVKMPGQTASSTVNDLVMNADIAPTIFQMTGVTPDDALDGESLVPLLSGGPGFSERPGILLEHLSYGPKHDVPSYCGLRTGKWKYVLYSGGFQELYSMNADPSELRNIAPSKPSVTTDLRVKTRALCDPAPPGFTPATWDVR